MRPISTWHGCLSFFALVFCFPSGFVQAQKTAYEQACVLWQGFEHDWTYNHRLNRLGSYVLNGNFGGFPYESLLCHAAATGIGGDVALFNTYYAYLAMNGVAVQSGEVSFHLRGKEGNFYTESKQLSVPIVAPSLPSNPSELRCVVLLNGFDIVSEGDADKLQMLHLSATHTRYDAEGQRVLFEIDVALLLDCQSLECSPFQQQFNYQISVHYLLLYGSSDAFHFAQQAEICSYEWDKKTALSSPPKQHSLFGMGGNRFPVAALGLSSVSVHLDRAHWLLGWHHALESGGYNPLSGEQVYELDLSFSQWDDAMKRHSANPRSSKFSSKREGWAMLQSNVVLLQFRDGFVQTHQAPGICKWKGGNAPADTTLALQPQKLLFNEQTFEFDAAQQKKQRDAEQQKITQLYNQYTSEFERSKQKSENKKTKGLGKKMD